MLKFASHFVLVLQRHCSWFGPYLSMFSLCLWTLRFSPTELSSFGKHIPPANRQGHVREDMEEASEAQQEIGESSYFTKWVVSSWDLGVRINVLQIPREGLAAQGVAEAFARGNVPVVHPHHTCRHDPNKCLPLIISTDSLSLPIYNKYGRKTSAGNRIQFLVQTHVSERFSDTHGNSITFVRLTSFGSDSEWAHTLTNKCWFLSVCFDSFTGIVYHQWWCFPKPANMRHSQG